MRLDEESGEFVEETLTISEEAHSEEQEEYYPTLKFWKDVGRAIEKEHGDYRWKIGDWLLAGDKEFGKKAYKEAVAITGYKKATLYDLARVAKRVPPSVRTEDLSWNHHRAVEELDREAQKDWLRQASAVPLSVVALRKAIKRQPLPGYPPRPITGNQGNGERVRYLRVELIEADIKIVGKLAEARKVTPGELLREIVVQHLRKPATVAEIENAEMLARANATENRMAGREKWERYVAQTIEDLLSRLDEHATSTTAPSDFVAMWERETGRKFTRRVFVYAMGQTELRAYYSGMSSEDFGLDFDPALHIRSSKR